MLLVLDEAIKLPMSPPIPTSPKMNWPTARRLVTQSSRGTGARSPTKDCKRTTHSETSITALNYTETIYTYPASSPRSFLSHSVQPYQSVREKRLGRTHLSHRNFQHPFVWKVLLADSRGLVRCGPDPTFVPSSVTRVGHTRWTGTDSRVSRAVVPWFPRMSVLALPWNCQLYPSQPRGPELSRPSIGLGLRRQLERLDSHTLRYGCSRPVGNMVSLPLCHSHIRYCGSLEPFSQIRCGKPSSTARSRE